MAHSGINTYFALDASVGGSLTDISTYLDGVTPTSDPDELDGTTFQPGVAAPARAVVAGFRTRNLSLSVKWTAAAETFFSAVEGLNGLNYNYGPTGSTVGMVKISGLCNCLSWTGPVSTVDGITTASCELRATTRAVATF
jgi:hypothetical protein